MNHDLIEKRTSRIHKTIALVTTIAIHGALFAYLGFGQIGGSKPASAPAATTVSGAGQVNAPSKPVHQSNSAAAKKNSFKIKA